MKFCSSYLDLKMELFDSCTNVLVLESPLIYREVVHNLIKCLEEDNDDWIFSDNDKILKKSISIDVINSLFSLDFQNRKIQKAVIDDLYNISVDERHYEKTMKMMSDLEAYYFELEWETGYNIKVELDSFRNIIKAGVTGILPADSHIEQIIDYVKISARLLKSKVLVFVGVQGLFTCDEWRQIEATAIYEGICILCIERTDYFDSQNKIIIDEDSCRVV